MIRPLALNGVICLPGEHPFKGSCLIKDGKVASIGTNEVCDSSCDTKTYDFGSNLIMPGFIEQHVHGALGSEFIDGSHTSNHKISTFLVRQGITAAVPTLITSPLSTIENAVRTLNLAVENDNLPVEIKGIFFEGPFISPRRKGAHRLEDIRSPQRELALQLAHLPLDTLKTVMLVAPEVSGGISHVLRPDAIHWQSRDDQIEPAGQELIVQAIEPDVDEFDLYATQFFAQSPGQVHVEAHRLSRFGIERFERGEAGLHPDDHHSAILNPFQVRSRGLKVPLTVRMDNSATTTTPAATTKRQ